MYYGPPLPPNFEFVRVTEGSTVAGLTYSFRDYDGYSILRPMPIDSELEEILRYMNAKEEESFYGLSSLSPILEEEEEEEESFYRLSSLSPILEEEEEEEKEESVPWLTPMIPLFHESTPTLEFQNSFEKSKSASLPTTPPRQPQKDLLEYTNTPTTQAISATPQNIVGGTPVEYDDYRLETKFYDGYVVHTTHSRNPLTTPQEISTWREERIIGAGMSGEVWLQRGAGKKLRAVKRLRRSTENTDPKRELLALIELAAYSHLFLEFFGWYEGKHYLYFAMEYIEYGHLGKYMEESYKVELEAKEITRQILEGLGVLHEKGICHRDLKPENILVASTDPLWVKIADFGISKQTKNTSLRTSCGTEGYLAPELRGVLPRRMVKKSGSFTYALDIWSLGCLLHEILTSHKPFFSTDDDNDSDADDESDSDIGITGFPPQPIIDIKSLIAYCNGITEFPSKLLKESQVSEEGIDFVKSLLTPSPKGRPIVANALQNSWLLGYKSDWFEALKSEFLYLGVNFDLGGKEKTLIRQISKIDIIQFFPDLSEERIQSMLLESVAKGYNSVISALLRSPSCESIDNVIRGKLFQVATEAGQLDTIKVLLHNNIDVGALIGNQTVLQWAVEAGHHNTAAIIQRNDREGGPAAL